MRYKTQLKCCWKLVPKEGAVWSIWNKNKKHKNGQKNSSHFFYHYRDNLRRSNRANCQHRYSKTCSLSIFFVSCSGSLCVVQTDHLPLEKLHTTRLSRLPAAEERQRQAHPAAWVLLAGSDQLSLNNCQVSQHNHRRQNVRARLRLLTVLNERDI